MSRPTLETPQGRDKYLRSYREGLLADTLPFWFPRCVDSLNGGYLHCRDADGSLIDSDKSVWAQGRMAWMLLELFNGFEKRPEWLAWAESGLGFLERHAFDADGRMHFHLAADGTPCASAATHIPSRSRPSRGPPTPAPPGMADQPGARSSYSTCSPGGTSRPA